MDLQFSLVVFGMVLVFAGMSWGMWELHKKLVFIERILKREFPEEEKQ